MAKRAVFYKGRRKKRNYAIIPTIIITAVVAVTLVLFYGMQKYAVITKDGVSVELPILQEGKTMIDSSGHEVRIFDPVEVQLIYDEPDYSYIKAQAGDNVPELRAIFVPAENLTRDKLQEYAARLSLGNALVLEMKPRAGNLMWDCRAPEALNYGLSMVTDQTAQLPQLIAELSEKDIYLVAQISCCLDELYASRSTTITLRRADNNANYIDQYGTWLDPYNLSLRNYVIEMVKELYQLGFDEVVLADVAHPAPAEGEQAPQLLYTRELSTAPSAATAVGGFAINVARALEDRDGLLSIYVDTKPALVRTDTNGQDAQLFLKLFDRVFLRTDKYSYSYNVEDIRYNVEKGNVYDRLVPVVENYLPDNSSWVLIDVEEDTD